MNPGELFAHAARTLPEAVRERLDGDAALDWAALEDLGTALELGDAARGRRRLPPPVEALVHRLVRDVGVVPADVSDGVERQRTASAWIHWVTVEADGESYQLRNDRSGEVHVGVHPETLIGYATLGLELAAVVHEAGERWFEAGERCRTIPERARSPLAECAVRMYTHLRSQPEAISGHPTTASLARTLEYAWNTQDAQVRDALSEVRADGAAQAHAPRRSYYSPSAGHRLSGCDVGEMRWLRALAGNARAGGSEVEGAERSLPPAAASGRLSSVPGAAPEAFAAGAGEPGGRPETGAAAPGQSPDREVTELERAAGRLPDEVRRRMGEAYGAGTARALDRLRSAPEVERLRAELGADAPGRSPPTWLDRLAAALLLDVGAQTRTGLRTGAMQLRRRPGSDNEYQGTEAGTGVVLRLAPVGLVQQVRLGLAFAQDAWTGLTGLRNAGKEGSWALAEAGDRRIEAGERRMLEAAQEIGRALDDLERAFAGTHGERGPTALEEAAMAAEALRRVGPTTRTDAGWPGGAEAPNARDPRDVRRLANVAEALHGEIRVVANQLIAGWIAEAQAYGEGRRRA